mmetsp:Transcript_3224/g.4867  ORF Transcript_3224/g.4867 Transcript_3224/m.4867 type:complete len:685 (+) Transcript_3224:25-2079(+)|eukprot:CAMPEP_0167747692 /NCGR_PEP_ID=MMETSP0110_2-20121227/4422_1 /TAXON_ID=629695 /ORGANISM="Gymnochlora sp., Strain CCMP2014" /LENGTH=684 /DNA_ID=CAMNT_0007632621 /DNA_START=1 /DNA_END=2055 /DNA_ORIENTATION=-
MFRGGFRARIFLRLLIALSSVKAFSVTQRSPITYGIRSLTSTKLQRRESRVSVRMAKIWNSAGKRKKKKPGTLVLLRHGESYWNPNNTFTGWADPDMTPNGCAEIRRAARLLLEMGYKPGAIYTSRLKRSIRSAWILLKEFNLMYRPINKEYQLNERMYGALTGMSKSQIALTFGEELVQQWRRSLDVRPPALDERHPYWPGKERKYQDLQKDAIPTTESLRDTMNRCVPLYKDRIEKDLMEGKNVLVVGHYNSLRGLVKYIDGIDSDAIKSVEIPTGIPLVFDFDEDMKPIRSNFSVGAVSGSFLAEREKTLAALARERELSNEIPGFSDSGLVTPVLRAISSLQRERELFSMDSSDEKEETFIPDFAEREYDLGIKGPLLVIMRHGKTEFNKLGLFTGWEDVSLTKEGRDEAQQAGKLLSKYKVEFDEVHTSCLSRAIETAWLTMEEMDALWLPVKKSWRLNERMYGSLTGLSKKLISQIHGEEQFRKWRRGYDQRPPPVDAFSSYYPGNDPRYVETIKDLPISLWQTLIRSLEAGKLQVARKMPRTESLKDCMKRTRPYFRSNILVNMEKNKNTLVVSSENAIRGLLMELCGVSTDNITSVEIPTGLPMIFDPETKSIKLLDDGKGDPLKRYNFGSKPELLFKDMQVFARAEASKPKSATSVSSQQFDTRMQSTKVEAMQS